MTDPPPAGVSLMPVSMVQKESLRKNGEKRGKNQTRKDSEEEKKRVVMNGEKREFFFPGDLRVRYNWTSDPIQPEPASCP